MLQNLIIGIVTFLEVVLGPLLLAAILIYGIVMYRRRGRSARRLTEASTRELYRQGAREEKFRNG